jgi:HEPN domain-containing protein
MKPITEVWLEKAREDLDVVLEIISREHLSGMVAFHSQQAVEKTLKGVIEEFEIGFVKTHNLERLLGVVKKQVNLDSGEKNGKEKVYLLEG